jgi:hypothetical protein
MLAPSDSPQVGTAEEIPAVGAGQELTNASVSGEKRQRSAPHRFRLAAYWIKITAIPVQDGSGRYRLAAAPW